MYIQTIKSRVNNIVRTRFNIGGKKGIDLGMVATNTHKIITSNTSTRLYFSTLDSTSVKISGASPS
jgi:hypothetical protein